MTIDLTSALGNNSGTTAAKKKADENSPEAIQERFMSLLVAQLKNQDPLAPMDNAQVTSQMAQLNTVTGINNLNATMEGVATSLNSNQLLQATGLLGRAVLTEGNDLSLSDGKSVGSLQLDQSVDVLRVNVLDAAANVVKTIDLGAQSKGTHEFSWDGKDGNGDDLPEGNYKFEIEALASGEEVSAKALTLSVVQGVRNAGADGTKLLTSNGNEVSFADIKQIF